MDKSVILKEIGDEVASLEENQLKEVFDFVRFIKHREAIDPTLEILQNEEDYQNVKEGIKQKAQGKVVDWNEVK